MGGLRRYAPYALNCRRPGKAPDTRTRRLHHAVEASSHRRLYSSKRLTIMCVCPVPDIRLAFHLSSLLRLGDTIDPMRLLVGPIAVLIVLCGWDFYFNHGKFTRLTVAATSDIARRMF
jgi:hypothetical protein